MSLFQCQRCGCCENTALASQGFDGYAAAFFDWTGIEDRKGKKLCSACGPTKYSEGSPTEYGQWHGRFPRRFLPLAMFRTAKNGNLEHVETGEQDYRKYAISDGAMGTDCTAGCIDKAHGLPECVGRCRAEARAAAGELAVDQRQAFEAWAAREGYPVNRERFDADVYQDPRTHAAWWAWKEPRGVLASQGAGWCEHCGEGVTDFCRGKLRPCPKGLPALHRNAAAADDWQRPDNTCPRCKQPAFNLFRTRLPGDELDTTHCGCLYAPGVPEVPRG